MLLLMIMTLPPEASFSMTLPSNTPLTHSPDRQPPTQSIDSSWVWGWAQMSIFQDVQKILILRAPPALSSVPILFIIPSLKRPCYFSMEKNQTRLEKEKTITSKRSPLV